GNKPILEGNRLDGGVGGNRERPGINDAIGWRFSIESVLESRSGGNALDSYCGGIDVGALERSDGNNGIGRLEVECEDHFITGHITILEPNNTEGSVGGKSKGGAIGLLGAVNWRRLGAVDSPNENRVGGSGRQEDLNRVI